MNCLNAPKGVAIAAYAVGMALYVVGQSRLRATSNTDDVTGSNVLGDRLLPNVAGGIPE